MVETIGIPGETNGYADAMAEFIAAHELNTRALLNLAEGKKKNAPRPVFDPNHSDNHWPVMLHHAEKGEKVVGKSLIGLTGRARDAQEDANEKVVADHEKQGWRREPYPKPQVAVLDPAVEKQALLDRNRMLEGMLVNQQDILNKLAARLERLEGGAASDPKDDGKKA